MEARKPGCFKVDFATTSAQQKVGTHPNVLRLLESYQALEFHSWAGLSTSWLWLRRTPHPVIVVL